MTNQLTTTPSRRPSTRDLNVYKRVKIWRDLQWEVATDLKLHYSSISKIVKRVERWIAAGGDPIDAQIADFAARQRLATATARQRLTRAIELATVAMERRPEPEPVVRRRLVNGVEVWREETEKPVPNFNPSAVRTLVSATTALERLDYRSQHSTNQLRSTQACPEKLFAAIIDFLTTCRTTAESRGHVPTTPDAHITVVATLHALLGDSFTSRHDPCTSQLSQLSFPGSSPGTQEPTAPALSAIDSSTDPFPPPTLNFEPGTLNSPQFPAVQEPVNLTNLNKAPDSPNADQPSSCNSSGLTDGA
jgi:hypothetical protein